MDKKVKELEEMMGKIVNIYNESNIEKHLQKALKLVDYLEEKSDEIGVLSEVRMPLQNTLDSITNLKGQKDIFDITSGNLIFDE